QQYLSTLQCLRLAVGRDPGAGTVGRAIGLAYLEQHELGPACQVQGKPVPAFLRGCQWLAAPFTVEPGLARNGVALAVLLDFAGYLVERLTVVVRSLALAGFFTVALVAMAHQRGVAGQRQLIAEFRAGGLHGQLLQSLMFDAAQRPVVDPGMEGLRLSACLAYAAARKCLGVLVTRRAGQASVAHPQIGTVPARFFFSGLKGRAKQRPLCTPVASLRIRQVRRDIPPFDAKAVMCTMITRKFQLMTAYHLLEVAGALSQPGKAGLWLGCLAARGTQCHRANRCNANAGVNVHRKTASIDLLADAAPPARPEPRQ